MSIAHVPICVSLLMATTSQDSAEVDKVSSFKDALRSSVLSRLGHILETPNHALYAAALHPKYGHLQFVNSTLRDQVWDGLKAEAGNFVFGTEFASFEKEFTKAALNVVREKFEEDGAARSS